MDASYQSQLAQLMDTNPRADAAAGRQWYYQTCAEFGYYQVRCVRVCFLSDALLIL